jgi:outer membrane protein OmpA-like peptidoglycan-associated protein
MTETSLQEEKMMEEKVKKIQRLFPSDQAKVVIDPDNNITIRLVGLNFEIGKSSLQSDNYSLLQDVQLAAEMFPDRKIKIVGHTDSVGSNEFNTKLSLERAKSVAQYMEEDLGVPKNKLEVIGAGENEPIAPNTTPEGRKMNRRIDVTFMAPGY